MYGPPVSRLANKPNLLRHGLLSQYQKVHQTPRSKQAHLPALRLPLRRTPRPSAANRPTCQESAWIALHAVRYSTIPLQLPSGLYSESQALAQEESRIVMGPPRTLSGRAATLGRPCLSSTSCDRLCLYDQHGREPRDIIPVDSDLLAC
jgi:hypothetical protein